MNVFGVVGWKNSGKTRLVSELVKSLTARGFTVSTIKHTHHSVDLDRPGKDTFQHREAGASEVLLASSARWALMHERRTESEPHLDDFLNRLQPVDFVIIEGFKSWSHDKLEVRRSTTDGEMLWPNDKTIRAIVSDAAIATHLPVYDPQAIDTIAEFVQAGMRRN